MMRITRGQVGAAVVELQQALEALDHDLPRYGADGEAGSETFRAVEEFLFFRGDPDTFDEDGDTIDAELVEMILQAARQLPPLPALPPWPGPWLHDLRHEHVSRQRGARAWNAITGITLHQTACCFLQALDPSPAQVAKAISRVAKIRAHAVVLRCGETALNAPLDRIMAHGHAFNGHDVGIEIDGYFEGAAGDPSTFWKPASTPNRKPMGTSEKQVASAQALCRWICETVAAHGGEVKFVHAHRQTHRGKPSDPGELLWREVGLYCKRELGLSDGGPDYYVPHHSHKRPGGLSSKAGPGRPIPLQWDPENTWDYKTRPKK